MTKEKNNICGLCNKNRNPDEYCVQVISQYGMECITQKTDTQAKFVYNADHCNQEEDNDEESVYCSPKKPEYMKAKEILTPLKEE